MVLRCSLEINSGGYGANACGIKSRLEKEGAASVQNIPSFSKYTYVSQCGSSAVKFGGVAFIYAGSDNVIRDIPNSNRILETK